MQIAKRTNPLYYFPIITIIIIIVMSTLDG